VAIFERNPWTEVYADKDGRAAEKTSWYTHRTPDGQEHVTRESLCAEDKSSIESND
jgi:hypothetical protein